MNWSYIGGFLDGEGSIILTEGKAVVSIVNTNFDVLKIIKTFVGYGQIRIYDRKPGIWKKSGVYRITQHENVLEFLTQVEPFLIVKKDKANNIINFIENKKWGNQKIIIDEGKLLKLRNDGKSLRELASIFNVSYNTIKNRLRH